MEIMPFNDSKKILGIIGLMAILIPFLFLSSAQKAEAVVPVHDAGVLGEAAAIVAKLGSVFSTLVSVYTTVTGVLDEVTGLKVKEYILDPLLKALAKSLLDNLTNSVVTWIRTGNWGDPLFITNFEDYLTDAADQATGRFMKEFLSPEVYNLICSPFKFQLTIALKNYRTSYGERMQCTLSTVLANAQNAAEFGQRLREGDWRDWINVTTNPQNNPLGALMISINELESRQIAAIGRANTESIFNQGFLSMKKCVEWYADEFTGPGPEGKGMCLRYETTSPGKWIQTQLSEATGIEFHELALADEINEIIAAAVGRLLNELMGRGIASDRDLPEPSRPPQNYVTLTALIDGNGSVVINPERPVYEKWLAEVVILTAVAGAEYDFDYWSGDVSNATSTITTIIMNSDKTVTAHFNYVAPPPLAQTGLGGLPLPSILFQVRKPSGTWTSSINISSGGSAQIRWSVANAASCEIKPGGWTGLSGSQKLSNITNSIVYAITCEGDGGSTSGQVSIFVLP